MTTPAVGDVVLVRCIVTGTGVMCFSNDPVLDVYVDGRKHVSFSVIPGVHTHVTDANEEEESNGMTTTTFTIHRNNRRFNAKKFSRYEEARSYVRKWIRKNTESLPIGASVFDYSNNEYRNPSVSRYGFSIKRVEG